MEENSCNLKELPMLWRHFCQYVNFYLELYYLYFYSFKVNLLAFKAMRLVLQKSLQEVFNKYCIVKYIALIFSEQQRLHASNQPKYYNRK